VNKKEAKEAIDKIRAKKESLQKECEKTVKKLPERLQPIVEGLCAGTPTMNLPDGVELETSAASKDTDHDQNITGTDEKQVMQPTETPSENSSPKMEQTQNVTEHAKLEELNEEEAKKQELDQQKLSEESNSEKAVEQAQRNSDELNKEEEEEQQEVPPTEPAKDTQQTPTPEQDPMKSQNPPDDAKKVQELEQSKEIKPRDDSEQQKEVSDTWSSEPEMDAEEPTAHGLLSTNVRELELRKLQSLQDKMRTLQKDSTKWESLATKACINKHNKQMPEMEERQRKCVQEMKISELVKDIQEYPVGEKTLNDIASIEADIERFKATMTDVEQKLGDDWEHLEALEKRREDMLSAIGKCKCKINFGKDVFVPIVECEEEKSRITAELNNFKDGLTEEGLDKIAEQIEKAQELDSLDVLLDAQQGWNRLLFERSRTEMMSVTNDCDDLNGRGRECEEHALHSKCLDMKNLGHGGDVFTERGTLKLEDKRKEITLLRDYISLYCGVDWPAPALGGKTIKPAIKITQAKKSKSGKGTRFEEAEGKAVLFGPKK